MSDITETSIYQDLSDERKKMQADGTLPEWFTTAGWQVFKQKYLFQADTYREQVERICRTLSKHTDDPDKWYEKFYDVIWKGWLALSTPVMCNTGTERGLPVSCQGTYIQDSIEGFFDGYKNIALHSKHGFGTSAYISDIRPRGTNFGLDGKADGVVPVVEGLVKTIRQVRQTSRRGAGAWYIDIEHADFDELIVYMKDNPDDLNVGWIIKNSFIEKLKSGDKDANRRYAKSLETKLLTGKGYYFFVDRANENTTQAIRNSGIDIKASNLCIAGDQRVASDHGYLTAKELYDMDEELILTDGVGSKVSSSKMKLREENVNTYKVILENGMCLTATDYHYFPVVSNNNLEKIHLKDLKIGHEVQVQSCLGVHGKKNLDHEYVEYLGLKFQNEIHDDVWSMNAKGQMEYIYHVLGNQDGEYSPTKNDVFLKYKLNSIQTCRDFQIILHNLNISCIVTDDKSFTEKPCILIPVKNYVNIENFNDILDKKLSAFKRQERAMSSRVKDVEYIGKQDVYCPTVDSEEHIFVAQGMRTYNCSEIALPSNEEYDFTCVLSSMNASKYDEWKDTDAVFTATVFLDCVASEFIEKAKNIIGLEKSVQFTKDFRAVGLGCLGFHTYLQMNDIAFEKLPANFANGQIFKHIQEESYRASQWMAKEWGEPKYCKGTGMRNATTMAVAPNMSSAIVCGSVSEGIQPFPSNAYTQKTAAGDIRRINPVLIEKLKAYDKYNDDVIDSIIENKGSVQHLDFLTDDEKLVFKTAFEINQNIIIRLAANRQRYIDQGQSLNLFFAADADEKYVSRVHANAFLNPNIKGLYYLRSQAGVSASDGKIARSQNATSTDKNKQINDNEDGEECFACAG